MRDDPRSPGLSRRDVLASGSAAGLLALAGLPLTGCGSSSGTGMVAGQTTYYMLSGRGRRISNAAKAHNANKVFATAQAAEQGRAHAGDTSRVVPIDTTVDRYLELFGDGSPCRDLRNL